jgi:hypothetical protein
MEKEEIAGWVVNCHVAAADMRGAIRYYIAAIPERDAAITAVERMIGGRPQLSLGSALTSALLERRKIARGDVVEVGTRRTRSRTEWARIVRLTGRLDKADL